MTSIDAWGVRLPIVQFMALNRQVDNSTSHSANQPIAIKLYIVIGELKHFHHPPNAETLAQLSNTFTPSRRTHASISFS